MWLLCNCIFASLMFEDDPGTLHYDQKQMRKHFVQCFEAKCFIPFAEYNKKLRIPPPLEVDISFLT